MKERNKYLSIWPKKKKDEIKEYLKEIDPLNVTPMEAMNILFKLKEMSKK